MEGLDLSAAPTADRAGLPGPRVLHAGCADTPLPDYIESASEVRLDANPGCSPDVVASLADLGDLGEFDTVYCSHALEHLYPDEVPQALAEFRRVLREGGHAVILVPDLEGVEPTPDPVIVGDGWSVSGLEMYYGGYDQSRANRLMAHHMGFVARTLKAALESAGFRAVVVKRIPDHNLLGVAVK